MKKCFFCIGCIFVLLLLCSCSGLGGADKNGYNPAGSTYNPAVIMSLREAEAELGDVNRVFTADGARFYSGQVIDNAFGFGEATFFGELVEYNLLNPSILNYVESLDSCNAMMHQNYPGQQYNPAKKYVEVSSYTSTSTHEVIAFEVRIFWGNFMDLYETDGWYAKSVTFSPDLKVDMQANKNIETGEYAYYWGTNENDGSGNGNSVVTHEVPSGSYPAVLSQLGTLSKVYTEFDEWDCIRSFTTGEGYKITTYYAEYTELQQSVISYFENQVFGLYPMRSGHDVTEDHSKNYVEYAEVFNVSDNSFVYCDLRYLVDWNRKETGDACCKNITAFQEDLDTLNYDSVYDYFTYQGTPHIEYPAVLDNLGELSCVCGYNTWAWENQSRVSYYGEYDSLKPEVTAFLSSGDDGFLRVGDYGYMENDAKKYIEYSEFRENGSVTYELRYVTDMETKKVGFGGWYAKVMFVQASDLSSGQDIYDYICAQQNQN